MKTHSITKLISSMIIFVLIIAGAIESRAQQVITFTNGAELKAFITYQTKDSVRYYLDTKPDVVYVETMDHIQRYKHYLHMTIGGPILFASGGILTGLGIAGLVSLSDEHDDSFTDGARAVCGIVTAVGIVGVITGIATTVSGALNMQKYKEKLNGFSFDLKYTPRQTGIAVVYRF
jgi:hypothetical protein